MSQYTNLLLAFIDVNAPTRRAVTQFCENVAGRTNGRVTVSAVPDKQLGKREKLFDTLREGGLDMLLQPADRWGAAIQKFGLIATPFAFDDLAHVDRVLGSEFHNWIAPDLERLGLAQLSLWESGFRQISNSRHPILKPEDLQGLKIRVPPASIYRSLIVAFGGVPVVVEFEKLATVLKRKLIDGQENPVAVFDEFELQSSQKYFSVWNYSYSVLGHLVNKKCLTGCRLNIKSFCPKSHETPGSFWPGFCACKRWSN